MAVYGKEQRWKRTAAGTEEAGAVRPPANPPGGEGEPAGGSAYGAGGFWVLPQAVWVALCIPSFSEMYPKFCKSEKDDGLYIKSISP